MNIAFLGTPNFAIPSLEALAAGGHRLTVFTQPDRPVGRKAVLTAPPVKVRALELGLSVYQFERMRSVEAQACLESVAPDLMVTAAFGQLLNEANLAVPRYGCINVHASLLPHLRGASPVQWSIIEGSAVTGVTIMKTALGLDTGDIMAQSETAIDPDEDAASLMTRLSHIGAELLIKTVAAIESGTAVAVPQNEALATLCRPIRKEQARIDFTASAQSIHNLVRGMSPWPGAYCMLGGETVKIWRTAVQPCAASAVSGECIAADAISGLLVSTGDGVIKILELQFPGGRRQTAEACVNGRRLLGEVFS